MEALPNMQWTDWIFVFLAMCSTLEEQMITNSGEGVLELLVLC